MAANTVDASEKYSLLSEPDDALKCLICLEVAEEPWQHGKCGRLFCEECINKYGKGKPCPNCKREQPQYFEDNKSKYTNTLQQADVHSHVVKIWKSLAGKTARKHCSSS
jgi:hypothetical protein